MADSPPSLSTELLAKQMEALTVELRTTARDSSEKRHQMNGTVSTVVMALRESMDLQHVRIQTLEKTAKETTETLVVVRDMSGVLRDVSDRLIGNEKFKTVGLVQEVIDLRTEVKTLVKAFGDEREEMRGKLKAMRAVIWTVGTLGGLVTFLQATGILSFLGHKP